MKFFDAYVNHNICTQVMLHSIWLQNPAGVAALSYQVNYADNLRLLKKKEWIMRN